MKTNHLIFLLMLVCSLLLVAGCGSDDDTTDGDTADGDTADGDTADGDTTDGDTPDGDTADGDTADGDTIDGDTADGDTIDGDVVDGDTADGDTVDGDTIDGDVVDGDTPDGDVIDGDTPDGDIIIDGDIESTDGEATCVGEGGSVPVIPNAPSCCEDLVAIGCDAPEGDACMPCSGVSICTYCGDLNCGVGENYCNCPADCHQAADGDVDTDEEIDFPTPSNLLPPPLSAPITSLTHVNEVAFFLPGEDSSWLGTIQDDAEAATRASTIGSITDKLMTDHENGRLITTKSADIDLDGKDELLVLSLYTAVKDTTKRLDWPKLTIFDDEENGFAILDTITNDDLILEALSSNQSVLQTDLAIANIDNDLSPEILISASYGTINPNTGAAMADSSLIWVFDDLNHSLEIVHTETTTGQNLKSMRIAAGDLDGDDRDEIVVAGVQDGWSRAWALDDQEGSFAQTHYWNDLDNYVFDHYIYNPAVAIDDFDADGVDEVAFAAVQNGACRLQVQVYDDANNDFAFYEDKKFNDCGNIQLNTWVPPLLMTGDIDANGSADLIIAAHDNYGGQDRGWNIHWFRPDVDDSGYLADHVGGNENYSSSSSGMNQALFAFHMAVGDYDRDRKADVIAVFIEDTNENPFGDPIYKYVAKRWERENVDFSEQENWSWNQEVNTQPLIALGDYDGDSITVQYTGRQWVAMSEPRIIIAMAMAPCWGSNVDQAHGSCWVAFGQTSSSSTTEGNSISISAGITLSMEAKDPLGFFSAKASLAMKEEFSKTETNTESISTSIRRLGNFDPDEPDDLVIFAATEYRRFEYEIIGHEDPEKIGEKVTINVPLSTNTFKKTVTAFNAQNGDYPDIGPETFTHTAGDPSTYPSIEDRNTMFSDPDFVGWMCPIASEPLEAIGESPVGRNDIILSLSNQSSVTEAVSVSVSLSAAFSAGGTGQERSVGVGSGSTYTITAGQATDYSGGAGDINSTDYAQYHYAFGMFVYNFEREDGAKYQVINWCVQQ